MLAAPEANVPKFTQLIDKFYKAYPKTRPLTPKESVERLLAYIASVGPADTGVFQPSPEFDDSAQ